MISTGNRLQAVSTIGTVPAIHFVRDKNEFNSSHSLEARYAVPTRDLLRRTSPIELIYFLEDDVENPGG